jgi:hypothetical protein
LAEARGTDEYWSVVALDDDLDPFMPASSEVRDEVLRDLRAYLAKFEPLEAELSFAT